MIKIDTARPPILYKVGGLVIYWVSVYKNISFWQKPIYSSILNL